MKLIQLKQNQDDNLKNSPFLVLNFVIKIDSYET